MIIKFGKANINLSDWQPIKQVYFGKLNWARYDLDNLMPAPLADPNSCCIHEGGNYHAVYFSGTLKEFDKMYLKTFGTRDLHMSMDLAKNHIDKFFEKYIKMLAFI